MAVTKLRGWVAAPATTWERRALGAVAVLIGAVGLIGFGLSAIRVAHLVRPSMPEPWMAPAVPVSIDLGILAFAGLDLLLTRRQVRVWWLSWVHDGLCGATLTLNVAGEHTAVGLVAHGTTIALWFAAVKAATATVKAWSAPPQRLTLACWVLAPVRSVKRWRAEKTAILDEPRSAESPSRKGQGSRAADASQALIVPAEAEPVLATEPVAPRRATLADARRVDAGRGLSGNALARAISAEGLGVTRRRANQWRAELEQERAGPDAPDGAPRRLEAVAR